MTAALSPELAIAYVRELSADVRAAVVLAGNGAVLAGDTDLAGPALQAVRALGDAAHGAHRSDAGLVVAARAGGHALVVVSGPLALESTTTADALAAVAALTGGPEAPATPVAEPKPAFVSAAEAAIAADGRPG